MNWQCPECGLLNDNDLIRCPCGYERVSQPEPEKSYEGIRGWLIIPLLGLIGAPILCYDFLYKLLPFFSEPYWGRITTPGSQAYHPYLGAIVIFNVLSASILGVLSVVTLWLFFRKSRLVPKLMIYFFTFIFMFNCAQFFIAYLIPVHLQSQSVWELISAAISSLLWVSYFLLSKRVKQTFVR
jgi:hypothetical protein